MKLYKTSNKVIGIEILNALSEKTIASEFKENSIKTKGKDVTICFTTFKACFNRTKDGDGSPTDEMLCEWLPCATMAYAVCSIGQSGGYIQDSVFFNRSECDVILGEEKKENEKKM